MMRKAASVLVAAVLMLLAGCATGPKFNTVEASLKPVPPGKARIFFYRSTSLGAGIQPEVSLNQVTVGKAQPLGVFFVDTEPGNMVVVTGSEVEKKLTFAVVPGDVRYVKLGVGLGILVYRIIPELVDAPEARKEIADLAYVEDATPRK